MEDPLIWRLLVLFILILINAVFTMSEIAVITVNDNRIKRMADEGNEKAKRITALLEKPTHFFSTIQVMVTLAGFLASAIAASSFSAPLARFFQSITPLSEAAAIESVCLVLITIILSFITLIFGELVPKQIGMQKAETVALVLSGLVLAVGKVLKPFVGLLTLTSHSVLHLMRINPAGEPESVTEEEIRMMVDIGEEKGSIAADEKELITNVFEFNNKEAEDVMTHRTDLRMIWVDDEPEVVRRTILENGYSRFPVYDEDADDILGILHLRDYLANMLSEEPATLRDLLRPAYFVPEQIPADVLFRDMQREKVQLAVVVDEYGGARGIVTLEDLVEEIVGNIYDEYDEAPDIIRQIDENTWQIPGSVELGQLEQILDIRLPIEEVDTLGGLIFSRLRTIPEDGSTPVIEAFGLRIQVEEILDRRVEWALVSRLEEENQEANEKVNQQDSTFSND
ncbi:MAG: hemolysin family protein [Clostridiales bacterium]|nr:hemolysin family protein [Clostridiales bacterium]